MKIPYAHVSKSGTLKNIQYLMIDKEAKDETYILNIGSIKNISCILPVSEMLKYPVIIYQKHRKVFLLRGLR